MNSTRPRHSSRLRTALHRSRPTNVGQLEVAWRWTSPDEAIRAERPELWTYINESTPLMAGGTLYTSPSMSQVAAIDAATGVTRWVFDPESPSVGSTPNHYHHRGVAYWEANGERRLFIATGDAMLIALDANANQAGSVIAMIVN